MSAEEESGGTDKHKYLQWRWADAEVSQAKWQSWPIVALPTETSAAVRKGDDGCLYVWVSWSGKKVCIKRVKLGESQDPVPTLVDDWLRSAWHGSSGTRTARPDPELEVTR